MPKDTYLYGHYGKTGSITVADYEKFETDIAHKWSKKAKFIRDRLFERYIDPVKALDSSTHTKQKRNGFYVMAVSCLLIETMVSFWRGWETTEPFKDPATGKQVQGKSGKAFRLFFRSHPRFKSIPGKLFYKHIRCGILHQGETTGGWTITRVGNHLYDEGRKRIDATLFHRELANALEEYAEALELGTHPKLRKHFDRKMAAIIRNCE